MKGVGSIPTAPPEVQAMRRSQLTAERKVALRYVISLVARGIRFRQRGLFARIEGRHDYAERWRKRGNRQLC